MKFHGREYCLSFDVDADDVECLALYEGSMALGAPVAACAYVDAGDTPSVMTFADDVPQPALEWLREEGRRNLLSPDAPVPYLESDRHPLWYYVGGAIALLGDAAYQWRRVGVHGGIWTVLLAVAAGLLLLSGYLNHRREQEAIIRDSTA